MPPEEWDAFLASLRSPLPSSFRVCEATGYAPRIVARLQTEFAQPAAGGAETAEETAFRPRCIPWYPRQLAWASTAGRKDMRKMAVLETYRQFIVTEHENGNLNRQEAVSMIPALLLDVQPHHVVLDMCAAPGSKTAQVQCTPGADEMMEATMKRIFLEILATMATNNSGYFSIVMHSQPDKQTKFRVEYPAI